MRFSYNWLQSYFGEKLPPPEKLSELLTFRFSEVESIQQVGDDTVFDLKILPDRACYALSHRGIARDVGAFSGMKMESMETKFLHGNLLAPFGGLKIRVENPMLCFRYVGVLVEGIAVSETPEWIRKRLASIGQRSINNVVDAANFVMFDIGQPLHAFDADNVRGTIVVRSATEGEEIETLDGKKIELDPSILVIADDEGPLAIAGIKGGKRAEVTARTTRLILESANFDSASVRRTSTKLQFRTDASKRFENKLTPALSGEAMFHILDLIYQSQKQPPSIAAFADVYPTPVEQRTISVSPAYISGLLGENISEKEIIGILESLSIEVKKNSAGLTLSIPSERLDLLIPEDIAEEIGRLHGYEKLAPKLPPKISGVPRILKNLYWQEKIKDFLVSEGFSEVCTYTFRKEGEMEVLKSLASDKNFLREGLTQNISEALEFNLTNAPLLELSQINLFEIGKVFPKAGEHTALCVGIAQPKSARGESVNEQIRCVRDTLVAFLGAPVATLCTVDDSGGIIVLSGKPIGTVNSVDGILELNLDSLIAVLPEPKKWDITSAKSTPIFSPISPYPFITRDVAVYVRLTDSFEDIMKIVNTLEREGKLPYILRKPEKPFDEFINSKLGKKSLAFRLVFQSSKKTLTDTEVNASMDNLYSALKSHTGWQIR